MKPGAIVPPALFKTQLVGNSMSRGAVSGVESEA